jgi:hypothetical protein
MLCRPWALGGLSYEHMFDTTTDWDEGLDEAQMEAVTHGEGPLIIAAGAGT